MKNNEVKFLNENLYQFRKEKGISQEELGNMIGVSRQAVYKWESGERMPDINNLNSLCQVFDKTIEDFITGADALLKIDKIEEKVTQKKRKMPKILLIILLIVCVAYIFTVIFKFIFFDIMLIKANKYQNSNNYSYRQKTNMYDIEYFDSKTNEIAIGDHTIIEQVHYIDGLQVINAYPEGGNILGKTEEVSTTWNYLYAENRSYYVITKNVFSGEEDYSYSIGFDMRKMSPYEQFEYYAKSFYSIKNILNPFYFTKIDFNNKDLVFEKNEKKGELSDSTYLKKIIYVDMKTGLISKIEDYEQNKLKYLYTFYDYELDKNIYENLDLTEEDKNKITADENNSWAPVVWSGDEQMYP